LNYLSISKSLEKVHSTALICRRCLSFNPQPQNQTLDTLNYRNRPIYSPRWFSGRFSPTWRHMSSGTHMPEWAPRARWLSSSFLHLISFSLLPQAPSVWSAPFPVLPLQRHRRSGHFHTGTLLPSPNTGSPTSFFEARQVRSGGLSSAFR
jgi:hypothetical protein